MTGRLKFKFVPFEMCLFASSQMYVQQLQAVKLT